MVEIQAVGSEEQLVVFDLAGEAYGVEIGRVQEIIRMAAITKLPRAPEYVEGVINLRGKVIPVLDLKKRFGLAESGEGKSSRIVVVEVESQTIGMVVDGVSEVLRIRGEAIEPPAPVTMTVESRYVRGIARLESRLVILLDLDRVLSHGEIEEIRQAA